MKTLTFFIILIAFHGVILAQTTELKYNLVKGETYKVKSSTIQDQTVTMQGMERKTETKNETYFSLKMLDEKPDFFLAEVKFDTIRTTVSMPAVELTSAEPGDINSENPLEVSNSILHRLSNSTMVVRMEYTGEVQDILNHKVIQETVLEGTDSLKGQAAMAKGQLELMVEKDALIGMIEGVTAYLPNKEVKTGGKWESSYLSKQGGIGMAITSKYILKELSGNNAVIEGDVTIEPASSEPTMMNGSEITNELRGLGKSNMKIDSDTGWLISASSKIQLSGNMNIKAPGQTMSLPIETQITNEAKVLN